MSNTNLQNNPFMVYFVMVQPSCPRSLYSYNLPSVAFYLIACYSDKGLIILVRKSSQNSQWVDSRLPWVGKLRLLNAGMWQCLGDWDTTYIKSKTFTFKRMYMYAIYSHKFIEYWISQSQVHTNLKSIKTYSVKEIQKSTFKLVIFLPRCSLAGFAAISHI